MSVLAAFGLSPMKETLPLPIDFPIWRIDGGQLEAFSPCTQRSLCHTPLTFPWERVLVCNECDPQSLSHHIWSFASHYQLSCRNRLMDITWSLSPSHTKEALPCPTNVPIGEGFGFIPCLLTDKHGKLDGHLLCNKDGTFLYVNITAITWYYEGCYQAKVSLDVADARKQFVDAEQGTLSSAYGRLTAVWNSLGLCCLQYCDSDPNDSCNTCWCYVVQADSWEVAVVSRSHKF